jgi:hypothetical protein
LTDKELIATVDQWDAEPFLLGTLAARSTFAPESFPGAAGRFHCQVYGRGTGGCRGARADLAGVPRAYFPLIPIMRRAIGYSLCGQVFAQVLQSCWA